MTTTAHMGSPWEQFLVVICKAGQCVEYCWALTWAVQMHAVVILAVVAAKRQQRTSGANSCQ